MVLLALSLIFSKRNLAPQRDADAIAEAAHLINSFGRKFNVLHQNLHNDQYERATLHEIKKLVSDDDLVYYFHLKGALSSSCWQRRLRGISRGCRGPSKLCGASVLPKDRKFREAGRSPGASSRIDLEIHLPSNNSSLLAHRDNMRRDGTM